MSPDDRKGLICTEEINRRTTTLRFRIGSPTPHAKRPWEQKGCFLQTKVRDTLRSHRPEESL